MFNEKDAATYATIGVLGVGALFVIDAYINSVREYIPIMIEMRR